ncbi:MAG: hypothetical protein ACTHJ3_08505 [Pararhizobium sp.]
MLAAESPSQRARTEALISLAERGLPMMHSGGRFAHTMRATAGDQSRGARPEGDSLRYATNVALGLHYVPESRQRAILRGQTAAELALATAQRGEASDDAGAVALAAWAAAEAAGTFAAPLFETLTQIIRSHEPVETVSCAWALIAALAARDLGDTEVLAEAAAQRLLEAQSPSGLFPHMLPSSSYGRLRAHIGCFADQVYATQGLARLSVATGRREALAAAEACAARICALQGPAGQWWWHYDTRDGSVVEGYPVYSVHQHAMGPMALLDVLDAGGTNHIDAIARGLRWLDSHPEVTGEIVDEEHCLIWRKAARREPANKSVRALSAFTTALKPGLHLPLIDTLCPPGRIDYECRPYEFGWMLYAWLSDGAVQRLAHPHAVEN